MPSSPAEETNHPYVTIPGCHKRGPDEDLVAAAKRGDELAFEMLIKRHQSRIFLLALRYTRIREDAEDIVQQTFQKVFVYLHKFQGKSSFSTWLSRIAINESLMFLRRRRAAREIAIDDMRSEDAGSCELEILDSSPNPEMSYMQREKVHILSSAIAQLSPALRITMELKELRELSGSDTARQIGVSLSAVKARLFHGRAKLRRILRHPTTLPRRSRRTSLGTSRHRHRLFQN